MKLEINCAPYIIMQVYEHAFIYYMNTFYTFWKDNQLKKRSFIYETCSVLI